MRLFLLEADMDIYATQDEKYDMTIAASKGDLNIEEIKAWLNLKTIKQG
jgi:death on curing protein